MDKVSPELVGEVLRLMLQDGVTLTGDLNPCERAVAGWVRKVGAAAIEAHLAGKKNGYEGSSRRCACGAGQGFVNHRARTVGTTLGSVTIRRAYYRCSRCGASSMPYDEQVGLGGEAVLLGDGAAWIWERVGGVLGETTTHIVDWYHAMQHVWECGRALYGEGTGATAAWVKRVENLLWNGEVRKILQRLKDEADGEAEAEKRKALTGLIPYLTNQDARLAYDRFRARGLDIGSGQVESACKNVVAGRMKRAGMRRSPRGAQATLSLRTVYMNDQWERFRRCKPLAA